MPFSVRDLINERQQVRSVPLDAPARTAVDLMTEYDYSQLPVLCARDRPVGMITTESIVRALDHLTTSLDKLQVSHALVRVREFQADDELFDLLDYLQRSYAALITDAQGTLINVVTNYDTAEYFRRRAEDMMFVQDIEMSIRDHIRSVFANETGELDSSAFSKVTDSSQDLLKQFQAALRHYLSLQGSSNPTLNQEQVQQVFSRHFKINKHAKAFEDLTMWEYSQLLLDKEKWDHFGSVFRIEVDSLRHMLDGVRETRNKLSHFRGEIPAKQREQLRFCAQWLARHQPRLLAVISPETVAMEAPLPAVVESVAAVDGPTPVQEQGHEASDVEVRATPNRYERFGTYLRKQPAERRLLRVSFAEIEQMTGEKLPESARNHRAWWANDATGHTQAQQWLGSGWQVFSLDMPGETVFFRRA